MDSDCSGCAPGGVLTSPSSSRAIEILIPLGVESVYRVMSGLFPLIFAVDIDAVCLIRWSADCFSRFRADAMQSAEMSDVYKSVNLTWTIHREFIVTLRIVTTEGKGMT